MRVIRVWYDTYTVSVCVNVCRLVDYGTGYCFGVELSVAWCLLCYSFSSIVQRVRTRSTIIGV